MWCSTLSTGEGKLVLYCFQDKGTGALLISEEGNSYSTIFRRKELVHFCSQEEGTGALLIAGEGKLVLYCFQEKGTGERLFSRRRTLVHYCSQGDGNWFTTVLKENNLHL